MARQRLLLRWAEKEQLGDIGDDDIIENRSLWMFADPGLVSAIDRAWKANTRHEFRIELLRLIREGAITNCVKLAREAVNDAQGSDYYRVVGLQAIKACADFRALAKTAKQLQSNPANASLSLSANFAEVLFPEYLDAAQLIKLIDASPAESNRSTEGFAYRLDSLYEQCTSTQMRDKLIGGIATLCLAPPFRSDYYRLSAKHASLCRHVDGIARKEVIRRRRAEMASGVCRPSGQQAPASRLDAAKLRDMSLRRRNVRRAA